MFLMTFGHWDTVKKRKKRILWSIISDDLICVLCKTFLDKIAAIYLYICMWDQTLGQVGHALITMLQKTRSNSPPQFADCYFTNLIKLGGVNYYHFYLNVLCDQLKVF